MQLRWDIFCQVIDNYGDIGVCWRLAADLGARGHAVRLWVDDASALAWMAPHGAPGVQVLPWPTQAPADGPGDVMVEAFGCDIAPEFIAGSACHISAGVQNGTKPQPPVWINLEYLSAEGYVERCHRLPSPIFSGPAAGWTRWFFYPGFTPATGGLLREDGLMARREAFDRAAWRAAMAPKAQDALWISLFSYEPPPLAALLAQCQAVPTQLLVTPGRSTAAVQAALGDENMHQIGLKCLPNKREQLSISYLDPCPQPAFDEMLWACDLNLVRGEDSLVRALWAGQALVWHIYPQHDEAHHTKLQAFLDWLQAPASLRQFHATWNGIDSAPLVLPDAATLTEWTACVRAARARLLMQDNLVAQLLGFVAEKR
ncbi:MAG TPA: elongation factor P maturation arginine rhamnosyltransferase EarP [Acidovorax sp.]|jgi:uncharacterized repeat protein (TIGR03837 family)|nr:elongation factor P maturation arginine rhamnosyltransferase EarP [Acidovorax sp.]